VSDRTYDKKLIFLAEEAKPDYRYRYLTEQFVSDRTYDKKFMFLAGETKPDYRYLTGQFVTIFSWQKFMFLAAETKPDYRDRYFTITEQFVSDRTYSSFFWPRKLPKPYFRYP
jgi:hypothetical protein